MLITCQCPGLSNNHKPGQCEYIATRKIKRFNTTILLCSDCTLPNDVELEYRGEGFEEHA